MIGITNEPPQGDPGGNVFVNMWLWLIMASWLTTATMLAADHKLTGGFPLPRTAVLIVGGFFLMPFFFVPMAAIYFLVRGLRTKGGATSPTETSWV